MAHDVFISHSSKDKPLADAICAGLEARGIRCWIAPRDVRPGEEWTKAIVDAIASSKVFLLLLTDNSNKSTQAIKEVDCAEKHEKTIIPFRLEDIQPTGSMEYYLGSLHWLDALTRPLEKHIEKLADYIDHILDYPKTELIGVETKKVEPVKSVLIPDQPVKKRNKPARWLWIVGSIVLLAGIITGSLWLSNPLLFSQTPTENPITTSPTSTTVRPTPTVTPTPVIIYSTVPTVTSCAASEPDPTEELGIGSTRVSTKDCMTLVYVPEGKFTMGDPTLNNWSRDDRKPIHTVTMDAFWIDQTEVTNAMYSKFVNETGQGVEAFTQYEFLASLENSPIVNVSWFEASAYCEWAGRRLPTEAEWEKAGRGTEAARYPWGEAYIDGNYLNTSEYNLWLFSGSDDGYLYAAPVGSYPDGASPYGALDMLGNVEEWVADYYQSDYYSEGHNANPPGPSIGSERVIRGSSYESTNTRITDRWSADPLSRNYLVGFRCALSAD
jgi:formylglycine-generating enzyme required for sulfatase activity